VIKLNFHPIKSNHCCLIVLDRDNTLIQDDGYVHKIEDIRFLPGVTQGLRNATHHGSAFVIITNQGGIGLKKYQEADYLKFTNEMINQLDNLGIYINYVLACPHHPDSPDVTKQKCKCRKPNTAMLQEAISLMKIDQNRVAVFGDSRRDLIMADKLGIRSYLVDNNLENLLTSWINSHERIENASQKPVSN